MLGLQKPFLADVLPRLISVMGDDFPELKTSQARISEIIHLEEEAFLRTLVRGGQLLGQVIDRSRTVKKISGEDAFKLKDTYGFPFEEIQLIAKDEALDVDVAHFEKLEEEAREKSRKAHKTTAQQFDQNFFSDFTRTHKPCDFLGYDHYFCDAHLLGLVVDGKFVDEVEEGQEAILLLDKTPFYAEMGGQVGDTGTIAKGTNAFHVYDTTAPFPGVVAHLGKMGPGRLRKSDKVHAKIEEERRFAVQNNHSATHLLHWALQKVLGSHIKQAGSLVDDRRLRFDFSHHKPLSQEEIREIENLVNRGIRQDVAVQTYEIPFSEAQKKSEIKQFFGEKYGETVRVVEIDISKELCGGTHAVRSGTIGLFKIAKESSIAAGVRRIEAITGKCAEEWIQAEEDLLTQMASLVKATPATLTDRLTQILEENKALQAELKIYRREKLKNLADHCLAKQERVGHVHLIAQEVQVDAEDLNSFADELLHKLKSGVVALGVKMGERCQLVVGVSQDLVRENIFASALIKEAAPLIQGGGGGKQTLAQAGGKHPAGIPEALDKIRQLLQK
jgi:alanyl-tRNA synthetase